ncbi:MAG TPA: amidohydrolase [Clostridiales bacterium]|nr:amidohydrolase [Clostridiales bacterium]
MDINPQIQKDREFLIQLRRHFHQYPEISMKEFNTAERIENELLQIGIKSKRIGETGVFGIIEGNGTSDRVVAIRADIDALAIQDVKTEDYASRITGVMHACGHDAHTTALIGAARYLKSNEDKINGKVYLIFQQGEEYGQGARLFVKEGILNNVDRVFGIHVNSAIAIGKVAVQEGPVNASVDHFTIKIRGKSSHVSTPHKGVDSLYIAAQTVIALQGIVSRLTDPKDSVVVGIGVLRAGEGYNIVAREAVIEGTTRCFTEDIRERTNNKIDEISKSIASIYGGEAEVTFRYFTSPLVNDKTACEEVRDVAERIIGEGNVVSMEPSLGGDDFAEFLKVAKGMYAFVGTGNPDKPNTLAALHGDSFDIDEEAILLGANLYADYALSQLDFICQ